MSILTPNRILRKDLFPEFELGREAFTNSTGEKLKGCTPGFLEGYREAFNEFYPHDDSGYLIEEYWSSHLSELGLHQIGQSIYRDDQFDRCTRCGRMWLKMAEPVHFEKCRKVEFFKELENRPADDDDGFELSHKAHAAGITKADWRDYRNQTLNSFGF